MRRRKEAASERNLAHDPQVDNFFFTWPTTMYRAKINGCLVQISDPGVHSIPLIAPWCSCPQAEARAALDQSQAANYGVFANFVVIGDLVLLMIVCLLL